MTAGSFVRFGDETQARLPSLPAAAIGYDIDDVLLTYGDWSYPPGGLEPETIRSSGDKHLGLLSGKWNWKVAGEACSKLR